MALKVCRICYRKYDPQKPHEVLSHTHQGQGPTDSAKKER
jgi:hypothetical protein